MGDSDWAIPCSQCCVHLEREVAILIATVESICCKSTLQRFNPLFCCVPWIQHALVLHAVDILAIPGPRFWNRAIRNSLPLRSLVVLHQAMKSVPDFLGISGFWGAVLNTCVGGIQGVLGGLVLPAVAKRLSGNRLSFLVTMGITTSCLLPAAVITFLDTHCLGRWSACWDPCRNNPEQFNRVIKEGDFQFPLLRSADICDSYQARAQTTLSKCVQVALLRLQDLWLPKILMCGVVMPASKIAREAHYKDSIGFVSDLAVHIAYAIITAGHLPLAMSVLWLSMLSITLLAAASWHDQSLRHNLEMQGIASIVALPQTVSTLIHAASASGSASALALFCSICLGRMARVARRRLGSIDSLLLKMGRASLLAWRN